MEEKLICYDAFQCIADQCPITCCQEWKIAVDEDTFEKWKTVDCTDAELGKKAKCEGQKLSDHTIIKDDARVIRLNKKKQCPFLSEEKLCRLVCQHGDQMLSRTCQVFPRQNSKFDIGREVNALMPGCPAVIDLIQEMKEIQIKQNNDIISFEELPEEGDVFEREDVYFLLRNVLMGFVQKQEYSLLEMFQVAELLVLDVYELDQQYEDEEEFCNRAYGVISRYYEEVYFEKTVNSIKKMEFNRVYTFEECNELFLDLAVNYREEAIYQNFLEPIARLAESYEDTSEKKIQKDIDSFIPLFSQYDKLMKKYVATEIFANLVLPEFDMESICAAFQWIAMEYAAIRHAIFLQCKREGMSQLAYAEVRKTIVIISRMTGYDVEDILEYLENSFESLIWEWGYLALITGQ